MSLVLLSRANVSFPSKKIMTEVSPAGKWYTAEEYHQKYRELRLSSSELTNSRAQPRRIRVPHPPRVLVIEPPTRLEESNSISTCGAARLSTPSTFCRRSSWREAVRSSRVFSLALSRKQPGGMVSNHRPLAIGRCVTTLMITPLYA